MGKTSLLTPIQKRFLALVLKEPYLLKRFYWTGGTVLAEFYLKHRESEDIDLFSEQEIHLASINKFISVSAAKLRATRVGHRRFLGLHTYLYRLPGSTLKVDFNYYPFPRINLGRTWNGLPVDSLEDIAVNKIQTISTKARARDFVDLYFIFKKENFSLERLVSLSKAKFDWNIDRVQLGETLSRVVTYHDLPMMLVPFDRKDMENFFLRLAKSLETEIFK